MTHLSPCDHCDGDYEFEVESPDYEVGLNGYQVFLCTSDYKTHAPECPVRNMVGKDIEDIEYKLSVMINSDPNYFNYDYD